MNQKSIYKITVSGCDDETDVYIELTTKQFDLLEKISVLTKKESTYGCMPVLCISGPTERPIKKEYVDESQ